MNGVFVVREDAKHESTDQQHIRAFNTRGMATFTLIPPNALLVLAVCGAGPQVDAVCDAVRKCMGVVFCVKGKVRP